MTWSLLSFFRAAEAARHPEDEHFTIDAAGWLHGPGVTRVPAHPSWYGYAMRDKGPVALLWHYTHTEPGTAKVMAKRRARKRDPKTDRAASWHFTVEADGSLWQMVSCEDAAWHCARGEISGVRVNYCAVGVELIGHGKEFTEAQVMSAEGLVRALVEAYGIREENCRLNHSDFDPKRRRDAGPVWNGEHLPGVLGRVFGQ